MEERGATRTGDYLLGHSDNEIDRLVLQARLVDPITDRFLRRAGLEPGMRVLDVGTGAGGMLAEAIERSAVIVAHQLVGAWSRV